MIGIYTTVKAKTIYFTFPLIGKVVKALQIMLFRLNSGFNTAFKKTTITKG